METKRVLRPVLRPPPSSRTWLPTAKAVGHSWCVMTCMCHGSVFLDPERAETSHILQQDCQCSRGA